MISIYKNTANTIAVTLKEATTLSPVYYLFEFIDTDSNVKFYCIPTDIGAYPERCNRFIITEKVNPNPLAGEVSLKKGDYIYNVYEQSSATNLDPTGLNIVEPGDMTCYDTPVLDKEYSGASIINTVYNG